jgi:hypothetical protein
MPKLEDSLWVDMNRLEPVREQSREGGRAPAPETTSRPSPFMQSSLPQIASGADQYVRQFYDRYNCPTQRILPAGITE